MMQDYPFVSVVVPIRNEEKYIQQTLQAILEQDYPAR
jgi:glycosyltransferase involved in cell wall biosynthesis